MASQRWRTVSGVAFLGVVVALGVVQFLTFPVRGLSVNIGTVTELALFVTVAAALVVVPTSRKLSTVDAEAAADVYSPILVGLGLIAVRAMTDLLDEILAQPELFLSVFEDVTGILGFAGLAVGMVRWNDHYERQARLLERQRDQLQEQNDRLEQFASVVTHDLRNPLEVAQGRLRYARESGDREHFEEAASALDRIEDIISEVMRLIRSNEESVSSGSVDLRSVATDAWRTVDTDGADLQVDVDGEATVVADDSLLRQLLENLFRNSIEHGGNRVTVRVGRVPGGFYVEDTGQGIPRDQRDEVFDVGYTTDPAGTGLGLNIVDDITAAHGWSVTVEESKEGGARFEFRDVDDGQDRAEDVDRSPAV